IISNNPNVYNAHSTRLKHRRSHCLISVDVCDVNNCERSTEKGDRATIGVGSVVGTDAACSQTERLAFSSSTTRLTTRQSNQAVQPASVVLITCTNHMSKQSCAARGTTH
ncbi:hypothetical protein LSAT2_023152, partial [Lamellibrachia satsuma]